MGKIKYFILAIAIILLMINVVDAKQPTQVNLGDIGYEIAYPQYDYVAQNSDFTLHVQVSNITNGYQIVDATCYLELYNSLGVETCHNNLTYVPNNLEYEINITGNFTDNGLHAFFIRCYNETHLLSGFANGIFQTTPTGEELTTSRSIIYLSFLGIIIFMFFVILFGISKLPDSNTKDPEGTIIKISYLKHLRTVLWITLWILLVAILFIVSNISYGYLNDVFFGKFFFNLFVICLGLTPIIIIMLFLKMFARIIEDKEIRNLWERGMFPQGKI